jgi:excisionase family DNA binding protein
LVVNGKISPAYTEQVFAKGDSEMEKEKPMERVYTVNQAAELTTLSPWTIWSKLAKGEIKRTKVGGRRTAIKESELRKLFVDEER